MNNTPLLYPNYLNLNSKNDLLLNTALGGLLTSLNPSPSPSPKSKTQIPKSQAQKGKGKFGLQNLGLVPVEKKSGFML